MIIVDNHLVTLCIPAYNHEKYIADAIESAINQTYKDIECIIINDGSIDNTHNVIKNYIEKCEKRFVRFEYRNRSHKGLPVTLNECLNWGKGKYFTGIASDDIMFPIKVELLVKALENNDEYGIAFGDANFVDCNNKKIFLKLEDNSFTNSYIKYRSGKFNFIKENIFGSYISLLRCVYLPAASWVARLELLKISGGWEPDIFAEDINMWLKLSKVTKFLYVDEPVAYYRIHSEQGYKHLLVCKGKLRLLEREKKYACEINEDIYWDTVSETIIFILKYNFFSGMVEILKRIWTLKFMQSFIRVLFKEIFSKIKNAIK